MSEITSPGTAIRSFRHRERISLDDLADRIAGEGCGRPSTAKLSRIETGKQPVTPDILAALEKIIGVPAKELRPDLAKHFLEEAAQ